MGSLVKKVSLRHVRTTLLAKEPKEKNVRAAIVPPSSEQSVTEGDTEPATQREQSNPHIDAVELPAMP